MLTISVRNDGEPPHRQARLEWYKSVDDAVNSAAALVAQSADSTGEWTEKQLGMIRGALAAGASVWEYEWERKGNGDVWAVREFSADTSDVAALNALAAFDAELELISGSKSVDEIFKAAADAAATAAAAAAST